jgi:hypothetical protein
MDEADGGAGFDFPMRMSEPWRLGTNVERRTSNSEPRTLSSCLDSAFLVQCSVFDVRIGHGKGSTHSLRFRGKNQPMLRVTPTLTPAVSVLLASRPRSMGMAERERGQVAGEGPGTSYRWHVFVLYCWQQSPSSVPMSPIAFSISPQLGAGLMSRHED